MENDIINYEVRDDYQEHSLHQRPYWQNMETCSTCYSEHIKAKQRFGTLGHSQETENALRSSEDYREYMKSE